jgi:TolA-binding protein
MLASLLSTPTLAYPLANDFGNAAKPSDPTYDEPNSFLPQEDENGIFEITNEAPAELPAAPAIREPASALKLNQLQRQLQTLSNQTQAIQESLKNIQGQLQSMRTPVAVEAESISRHAKPPVVAPSLTPKKPSFKTSQDAVLLPGEGTLSSAQLPDGPAQEQYAYALSLLRNRDLIGAQQTFKAFITMHPNDPLIVNAKYWLGDIAFQHEDYDAAAVAFGDAYQEILKHKKNGTFAQRSSKAPEILAKLSCSLTHLGRSAEACITLQQLEKEFPHLASNAKAMAFRGTSLPKCPSKKR